MDPKQVLQTSPPKKHKSSHHSKHSSKKHSKSGQSEGGKPMVSTSPTKKEVSMPVKKRPMISESDSEDEIPLAVQKSVVKEESNLINSVSKPRVAKVKSENPSHKHAHSADGVKVSHNSMPVKVKSEKPTQNSIPNSAHTVKVKGEKRSSRPNGSEVPVAKRKPSATPSVGALTPSKATTAKVKAETGTPSSTKRKKSDESEYEQDQSDGENDEDFKPSSAKKPKKVPTTRQKKATVTPASKKGKAAAVTSPVKKTTPAAKTKRKGTSEATPTKGGKKKKEEEKEVWKWWEEEPHPHGVKWLTLEHKGPYFAPSYEPLPPNVKFMYDGKSMELSEKAEEAAGFFAKMLDHDYTSKDIFCDNFFEDWRKEMTESEAEIITDFSLCDFRQIHEHYKERSEARKAMSKEEKLANKKANEKILEEYGWCIIDGHKERIGNFKIEPPGLFRGRGDHPKQGKIKRRTEAEDVQINIGKKAVVPLPPPGHMWKEIQHDNKVTWLASWTENIQGSIKYVMLNPTSRLKAEKDWAKYETARRLKTQVDKIRSQYAEDWKAKEMKVRQRAVALYFIDKLALRAGNEKDTDETADTVGCCSLRVEHIKLHEEMDDKGYVLEFDFLGKDSIRYYNCVPVEKQVFKNVTLFMKDKNGGDDLFDRLTTATLNKHLNELMDKLTAKVFRTFNASRTLQEQLDELTVAEDTTTSKLLSYNRANRAVAILCNHQRAAPKTFDQQMTNLQGKIQAKEDAITETRAEIKSLRKEARTTKDSKTTKKLETKQKQLARLEDQLHKLEIQATDKQENKEIALGTSKLNYLDPRISVAWCKKWEVPIEKVYNKTQREKFAWAIDMADEDYEF